METRAPAAAAWLSLGSNIEPERHLVAALAGLRARFGEVALSPLYRTAAVGFEGPDFLNAAARIRSDLAPQELADWLHALEAREGRRRDHGPRYASRTLDVDLVLYDDLVLDGTSGLRLPRRDLAEQAFVLKPMADLAPDLVHPLTGRTLARMWAEFTGPTEGMTEVPWPPDADA